MYRTFQTCMSIMIILSVSVMLAGAAEYAVAQDEETKTAPGSIHHNIGAGVGIPFGVLGVNYELEMDLGDSFSISPTAAVGHTLFAGVAWNVGLQTRFASKDLKWRPGIGLWYGTNTIIEEYYSRRNEEYYTETGLTIGGSLRYRSYPTKKSAWDFHLLYVLTPDYDSLSGDSGSSIKIALGYTRRL